MRINTSLTRLLSMYPQLGLVHSKKRMKHSTDIKVPVLCAPMAGAGGAKLATQVTKGGGFGFMAAGYNTSKQLRDELISAKSLLDIRASAVLPIGVGYLAWKLEESESAASDMLDAALENHVQAVWLAFGAKIGKWVEYIRQADAAVAGGSRKTLIFVLVNSVEEALVATKDWKADVLVAQGSESGGHGGGYAPSVFSLVSSILTAIPKDGPLVVAAGGIANGAQIAGLLTLGASGAALGTRFLLTPESYYSDIQKKALLAASSSSTVRTLAFDHARNTLGWPAGVDGRGLRNRLVEDFEKGEDHGVLNEKLQEGVKSGNPDLMITWAGQGVGEMKEIRGAQAIVHDLEEGIIQQLQARLLIETEKKQLVRVPLLGVSM
ncbi:hypothetical protein NLI96_g8370 [Meripilus lineatus]|uniref:Nitronate monooxygenase domain-containing protein n=1 Tax=Meripilus lineatus TaxID=2056292 RepID=A0AAD5UZ18_9APHY|nr:hypothetical protein NLI96_g8370 [Physisporinus lineatus]